MIYKLILLAYLLLALSSCASSPSYSEMLCEGLRANEQNRNPAVTQAHIQDNCMNYRRVRDKELTRSNSSLGRDTGG
jgi:hypothetical protein